MLELTVILCYYGSDGQGVWSTITLTTDDDNALWDETALIDLINEEYGERMLEGVVHVGILHYEEEDE